MVEALIGILVGGVLTGGVQAFFRWQDGRDSRRVAVRTLHREMRWFWSGLDEALKQSNLLVMDRMPEIAETWINNQAAFVRLPSEEWRALDLAVRSAGTDPWDAVGEALARFRKEHPDQTVEQMPVTPELRVPLERLNGRVERAIAILDRYA
jgi:hypothetical protein